MHQIKEENTKQGGLSSEKKNLPSEIFFWIENFLNKKQFYRCKIEF